MEFDFLVPATRGATRDLEFSWPPLGLDSDSDPESPEPRQVSALVDLPWHGSSLLFE